MNHIIAYILKVIICSAIFFAYYLLALRNKNFHPYNRFYLLSTAVISAFLPLLHISMFDFSSDNARMLALFQMLGSGQLPEVVVGAGTRAIDWEQAGILASLTVTLILLILILVRIARVFRLKKKFPSRTLENVNFINTNIEQAPFSFLNNLFWRKDILLSDKVGEQIYRHEMAHIRQKHSLDKILLQVLRAVFWMNPVYYYMQRELLLIHEFIADQKAIEEGDGEAFARMLLTTQFSGFQFEPAHSLSYSSIKKRLHMITNSHKPKYSYLRRLLFLPLLFMVTFVFALRAHQKQIAEQTATLEALVAAKQANAVYDVRTGQPGTAGIPADTSIADTTVIVANKFTFTKDTSVTRPVIFIDGKEQPVNTHLTDIDASTVQTVNVYKPQFATGKFGEKGKNGLVFITTKAAASKTIKKSLPTVTIVSYKDTPRDGAVKSFSFSPPKAQPATDERVVIGYKAGGANPANTFSTGGEVKAAADDRVVVGYPAKPKKMEEIGLGVKDPTPLYVLDGEKISEAEMKAYPPEQIQSISVLKGATATSIYGSAASGGAILITSKAATAKSKVSNSQILQLQDVPGIRVEGTTQRANGKQLQLQNVQGIQVDAGPQFPGGATAWKQYLERHLQSSVPKRNGAPVGSYVIVVSFLVDKQGNTSEFKAISKPDKDYGTAAEAVRAIRASGRWEPAMQNGKPVVYREKQKIVFQVLK